MLMKQLLPFYKVCGFKCHWGCLYLYLQLCLICYLLYSRCCCLPLLLLALHYVYTFCLRHDIKSLCKQSQRKTLCKMDHTCSLRTSSVIITQAASRTCCTKRVTFVLYTHTHTHTHTHTPNQLQRQIRKTVILSSKWGILYHVTVCGASTGKNLNVMKVIHRPLRPLPMILDLL